MNIVKNKVIANHLEALNILLDNIPRAFEQVVNLIINSKGRVILSGIGKSGYIANKISSSLASTGTNSFFIHPAEASHGDLGMIHEDDIVMLLSNSGETQEMCDIISYCKRFHIPIIAMTMNQDSMLGQSADYILNIPKVPEASAISAPTTSALLMLSLGDALMVAVYEKKGFSKEDYKLLHPGGKIASNLKKVKDLMHIGPSVPYAAINEPMSTILILMSQKGFGTAIVVNQNMELEGIITDGDLRRHMNEKLISLTAKEVMTYDPKVISPNTLAIEGLALMNQCNITSLAVVEEKKVIGIIHLHDILRAGIG